MTPESGANQIGPPKHCTRHAFVAGVRLPFFGPHRRLAVVANSRGDLRVPVSALDKPNGEARSAPPAPRKEVIEVALGFLQVRLQNNADIGPVGEFVFEQNLFEKVERKIVVLIGFQVDVDEGPGFSRLAQQRA